METQKTTSKKGSVKSSNKPAAKKDRNSRRKKEMIDAEVKDEYTNLSVSWPQNRLGKLGFRVRGYLNTTFSTLIIFNPYFGALMPRKN